MRKLGQGQSVVFCVTEEIKMKILELLPNRDNVTIDVADILNWVIFETCADLRRSMPLWAAQGRRNEDQKVLWASARSEGGLEFSDGQVEKFLEEEAQTLEQRYRPHGPETSQFSGWDMESQNINRIIERCQKFASTNLNQATLQEEQERELSPEIEQESEVERPAPAEPETHSIHGDMDLLIRTGKFMADSKAFLPAFEALRSSSAAAHLEVSQFPHDLYVTTDFARTIKSSGKSYISDAYQRSVQWILTITDEHSNTVKHMVIVSPFEVQELLPVIKTYSKVTLHLYAPRPNLEFRSLDTLDLSTEGKAFDPHTMPPKLIVQLNLFAGQLYLTSFTEYTRVCDFLGLAWKAAEEGILVKADGFILSNPREDGFKDSPVMFLKVLMTKIRRNCERIEKTHLGKLLAGAVLDEDDFDNH